MDLRAYLVVEQSIMRWATQLWRPYARTQAMKIKGALARYDYERAYKIAHELSFDVVLLRAERQLDKFGVLAMTFGMSNAGVRIGHRPPKTALWPEHVATPFKRWFANTLRYNGEDYLRDSVLRVIRAAQIRDETYSHGHGQSDLDPAARVRKLEGLRTLFKAARLDKVTEQKLIDTESEDDYVNALGQALDAAVTGEGQASIDTASNLFASRVGTYAFLSEQYADNPTATYQISAVLDERLCRFCEGWHGVTFDVDLSLVQMQEWLGASDSDSAASVTPWPSQSHDDIEYYAELTAEQLQALGYDVPPAHVACRCVVVPEGTIPDDEVGSFQW